MRRNIIEYKNDIVAISNINLTIENGMFTRDKEMGNCNYED